MKIFALVSFLAWLLLGVRVMFFGVQRRVSEQQLLLQRWPLALAAFLVVVGATIYARSVVAGSLTGAWFGAALLLGVLAGWGAWWIVQRSASIPSTDPEDDPRYRFQGHVARLIEDMESRAGEPPTGRIAFTFDGKRYEFRARWSPEAEVEAGGSWKPELGRADSEVVIERVDDDLAFVEPWAAIEERL